MKSVNKSLKHYISLTTIFALILSLLLSGCASGTKETSSPKATSNPNQNITLKFATSAPEAGAIGKIAAFLKSDIEKRSNGRISLEVFTNGSVFGGDREIIESVQRGDATFIAAATAPFVMFEPKMGVFDVPFLYKYKGTLAKTIQSINDAFNTKEANEFTENLFGQLNNKGLQGMIMYTSDMRELSSNRPIKKLEDLKGFKVRTMENKYHIALWKALGANPTPMSATEVFTALEQNTIDGQENGLDVAITSKIYEVQKSVTFTNHIPLMVIIAGSKKVLDPLPEDLKSVVNESMAATRKFAIEISVDTALKNDNYLKDKNVTVNELSPEEEVKFREATKSVEQMVRKDIGDEIVDKLLALANSIK